MSDEDVIFNLHAFADERMAGNLDVVPDNGILLNLNEGADLGIIANRASIKIDECENLCILAQLYIRCNTAEIHELAPHRGQI
jgi:hypothetical protein